MKLTFPKYFPVIISVASISFAQTDNSIDKKNSHYIDKVVINESRNSEMKSEMMLPESTNHIYENLFISTQGNKFEFDIVSSFGSNINFGGFWDKYAVLNFSPNVFIQPLDFLSIYANQTLSCLVPVTAIKEHFESLAFQSAAILAVDNSMKFLFPARNWITDAASYVLKNLIVNFIVKPLIENTSGEDNQILKYESYYYSVGVRF